MTQPPAAPMSPVAPPRGLGRARYAVLVALLVAAVLCGWMWTELVVPGDRFRGLHTLDAWQWATRLPLLAALLIGGGLLSARRLRDAGWPAWFAWAAAVPGVNLVLLGLCLLAPPAAPSPPAAARVRAAAPPLLAAAVAALLTVALLAWSLHADLYGWAAFVATPLVLGFASTWAAAAGRGRSGDAPDALEAAALATAASALAAVVLLAFGLEGVICLAMAAPLWLPLAILGGLLAVGVLRWANPQRSRTTAAVAGLLVLLGVGPLGLDAAARAPGPEPGADAPLHRVASVVEIDAPPEAVWPVVLAFPPLPEPGGWLLRSGIAYPREAWIEGEGVGAIRHCVFSTGSFVEPITAWEPPHRLAFRVASSPPPMEEVSLYEHLHPPHLDGAFASRRGEFLLEPLPGGRTRLTGTTWYQHRMAPSAFWRLWCDKLVHATHAEVLGHIREVVEEKPRTVAENSP